MGAAEQWIAAGAAEAKGFDVLLTADKKMYSQQNHTERQIGLVVLGNCEMKNLERRVSEIVEAIDQAKPGSCDIVPIPVPPKTKRS